MVDDRSHFEHNREAYRRDIGKYARIIAREMLRGRGVIDLLLEVFRYDQNLIAQLVAATTDKTYFDALMELDTYPLTGYGWSILPETRRQFERPELSNEEWHDIRCMRSQEDRAGIEFLRSVITRSGRKEPSS